MRTAHTWGRRDPRINRVSLSPPVTSMHGYSSELKQAARGLVRRPLFTAVAVLSVAIGVGANATIFSVFNALLLRTPAGIEGADRVVELGRTQNGRGSDSFTYHELQRMRELGGPLENVAGYRMVELSVSATEVAERAIGLAVTHEYFAVLGVRPQLGRFFSRRRRPNGMRSFWCSARTAGPGRRGC